MGNKLFVGVVVLLWGGTMSWLVASKILPHMDPGLPPSYRSVRLGDRACWQITWDDRPIGWAVSEVVAGAHNTRELYGRVLLEEVELAHMAPAWMASLVETVGPIRVDARSRIELDPLGNLSSLEARLNLNDIPSVISMRGRVRDGQLQFRVKAGNLTYRTHRLIPEHARLASEMSPTSRLPAMYVGRKWTMEIFSPFRPPNDPVEAIQGEVTQEETVRFGDDVITARRVEFRRLQAAGVADEENLRAILWVTEDGLVVRQEVRILNAKLRFQRMVDEQSLRRAERMIRQGWPTLGIPRRTGNVDHDTAARS